MPRKSFTIEQIISKLRESGSASRQGKTAGSLPIIQYQTTTLPLAERICGSGPIKYVG